MSAEPRPTKQGSSAVDTCLVFSSLHKCTADGPVTEPPVDLVRRLLGHDYYLGVWSDSGVVGRIGLALEVTVFQSRNAAKKTRKERIDFHHLDLI